MQRAWIVAGTFAAMMTTLVSCAQQQAAPAVDAAAEEQAVRTLDKAMLDAMTAKDSAAAAKTYASDAVLMPAGEPKVVGRDSIGAMFGAMFRQMPDMHLTWTMDKVEVAKSGDLAFASGSYQFSGTGPRGPMTDTGKTVVVFEKENGEWKCARDIWNSDQPPPGAAPAAAGKKKA